MYVFILIDEMFHVFLFQAQRFIRSGLYEPKQDEKMNDTSSKIVPPASKKARLEWWSKIKEIRQPFLSLSIKISSSV